MPAILNVDQLLTLNVINMMTLLLLSVIKSIVTLLSLGF